MANTITTSSATISANSIASGYITFPNCTTATTSTSTDYILNTVTTTPICYQTKLKPLTISLSKAEIKDGNAFKDVIEYKKEKVYGFEFEDGTKVKTIRDDDDVFSLPYAFYLALAKKIYGKELTFEGVLVKTKELSYSKYHAKLVEKGLKLFKKKQEEEAKKKQEEEEKKEQRKRYIEKKKKRDKKLEDQYEQDMINMIAKAIKKSKEED